MLILTNCVLFNRSWADFNHLQLPGWLQVSPCIAHPALVHLVQTACGSAFTQLPADYTTSQQGLLICRPGPNTLHPARHRPYRIYSFSGSCCCSQSARLCCPNLCQLCDESLYLLLVQLLDVCQVSSHLLQLLVSLTQQLNCSSVPLLQLAILRLQLRQTRDCICSLHNSSIQHSTQ